MNNLLIGYYMSHSWPGDIANALVGVECADRPQISAEARGALRAASAVGRERVEHALELERALAKPRDPVEVLPDGAVEDQRSHAFGEEVGVRGSDDGAV